MIGLVDGAQRLFDRSPIVRRYVTGAIWSILGAAAVRGAAVLASLIAARKLGQIDFGHLSIIQSTWVAFEAFGGLGVGFTATQMVARYRQSDPARVGSIVGFSTLVASIGMITIAGALFFLSPQIAKNALHAASLSTPLRIAAIGLLFSGMSWVELGALAGLEQFSAVTAISIRTAVAMPILVWTGCKFGGVAGAVAGLALYHAANWYMLHRRLDVQLLNLKTRRSLDTARREYGSLMSLSLPALLMSLTFLPVNWACLAMVAGEKQGYLEVAVFNAALQWRNVVLFFPTKITSLSVAMLSSATPGAKRTILKLNIVMVVVVSVVPGLIAMILSHLLMRGFGPGFTDGTAVLRVLMITTIVAGFQGTANQALMAEGRVWQVFGFDALSGTVQLALSAVLVPTSSALGLAWATVGASVLRAATQGVYMRHLYRQTWGGVLMTAPVITEVVP